MGVVLTVILTLGWILAGILGLILLILLLVLLSPVTYSFEVREEKKLSVRAGWLFHLIRFRLTWWEGQRVWNLKVAWKTIFSEPSAGEESAEGEETSGEETSVDLEEPTAQVRTAPAEETPSSDKAPAHDEPQKERKTSWKSRIQERRNKLRGFRERIEEYPEKKETVAALLEFIKKLLKALLPRKVQAYIQFGMEDPATTGYILGLYYEIMPFLPFQLEVVPNFKEKVLEVDAKAKGRFTVGQLLWLLLRTYMDKHIRYLIAYIRNKKN